jgi:hypothetical protein
MTQRRHVPQGPPADQQQAHDRFYITKGPCCAGCDYWRHINGVSGECRKAAPVSSDDRAAMLGIESASINFGAGHPITRRDHWCGEFADTFDWSSLPPEYRLRIGLPVRSDCRRKEERDG